MANDVLFNRINGLEICDRLDSEYYTIELLDNEHKINQFSQITLEKLVDPTVPNNISDLTSNGSFEFLRGIKFSEKNGIPFIRTQNLLDGYVNADNTLFVDDLCAPMVNKSLCRAGDLIVCRKGKVGSASSVHENLSGAAISENITRFSLNDDVDADFIAAFLNSGHGRKRFLREATGVIQKWINNEKLREISVLRAELRVEKYIGDKVRQAERLRAWAKELEVSFTDDLKYIAGDCFEDRNTGKKYARAKGHEVSYTLNSGAFNEERLRVQRYLLEHNGKRISELATISGSTISGEHLNTPYIGLDAIQSNSCKLEPSTIGKADISGTCRLLREGPVIAKLRPYLNKVTYIPSFFNGSAGSTELLCVTPIDNISGWYLYGLLKSELVLKQLRPLATGATHPRIDQYDIYNLVVPLLDNQKQLGELLEKAQKAYFYSGYLTQAAKLLVEALIEGQLTEQQLMDAETALSKSNQNPDRAILERLTNDGLDGDGDPLFPDLDQLYRLLEEVNND